MANIERTYTIPLRREWLKSPKYRRAKKAVTAVKEFLIKHMKSEDVRLGKYLNKEIWKDGIRSPPGKIKVNVIKDEKGVVRAELFGKEIVVETKKKEEKKSIAEKMKETITGKKEEKKLPVKKKKKEEKAKEKKEAQPEKTEEAKEEKAGPEKAKPAVKEASKEGPEAEESAEQ